MILTQTVSQSANRQDSRKRIVNAGLLLSRVVIAVYIQSNRNAPQ